MKAENFKTEEDETEGPNFISPWFQNKGNGLDSKECFSDGGTVDLDQSNMVYRLVGQRIIRKSEAVKQKTF